MDVLGNWERAEDEKIQELIEIRKKVRHYRQKEKEKADNIIINNKQFTYTLCNNINKYLNAENEQERKIHKEVLRNIFNCLKVKSNIYITLERIINNMQDYEQGKKENDNNYIYAMLYIDNDFKILKDKLISDKEKEKINELKRITEHNQEKEYNNNDINNVQSKYNDIISSILYDAGKTIINLLDGEQIELINNDRLIII